MKLQHLFLIAIITLGTAFGQTLVRSAKIAPEFEAVDSNQMVDVLVKYKETPTQFHQSLATRRGGRMVRSLDIIKTHHYRIPAGQLAELAADPLVESIHPDREVKATGTTAQPDYGWVSLLNLPSPTSGSGPYDGSGVTVAVIDSGIDDSHDFSGGDRIVYSQSFVSGDSSTNDAYGHGTHIAGIIGGNGSNSTGSYIVRGLAPGANIVNLRVLDGNGMSTDSAVIAAIQRAIALKNAGTYNIRIINLSLGRPVTVSYKNDPLCQAVEAAWNNGIVVIVAAGNMGRYPATSGYGTIMSPGNDPYVITVGAINTMATLQRADDKMTSYSSKGPTAIDHVVKPDLVAPGNRILSVRASNSSLVNQLLSGLYPTVYFQLSGTSMAAPMVSGAAALLLQQNRNLTPDQVKAKLMLSASKTIPAAVCAAGHSCPTQAYKSTTATDSLLGTTFTTYYDLFTIGAGYLDANAALNNSAVPSGSLSAISPTAVYNSSTGTATIVNGSSVIWGSSATWGSSVIWGTSVLWGNSVTWGSSVIWGTNTASASSVIWGSSVTWGASVPASESLQLSILGEQ